jgi:hypothetical protein
METLMGMVAPPVFLIWTALCCAFWFHPTHGSLRPEARFIKSLPSVAAPLIRWYAAFFLCLFTVMGVVGPLLFLVQ